MSTKPHTKPHTRATLVRDMQRALRMAEGDPEGNALAVWSEENAADITALLGAENVSAAFTRTNEQLQKTMAPWCRVAVKNAKIAKSDAEDAAADQAALHIRGNWFDIPLDQLETAAKGCRHLVFVCADGTEFPVCVHMIRRAFSRVKLTSAYVTRDGLVLRWSRTGRAVLRGWGEYPFGEKGPKFAGMPEIAKLRPAALEVYESSAQSVQGVKQTA